MRTICPFCHASYRIPDEAAGKPVRCASPHCGHRFKANPIGQSRPKLASEERDAAASGPPPRSEADPHAGIDPSGLASVGRVPSSWSVFSAMLIQRLSGWLPDPVKNRIGAAVAAGAVGLLLLGVVVVLAIWMATGAATQAHHTIIGSKQTTRFRVSVEGWWLAGKLPSSASDRSAKEGYEFVNAVLKMENLGPREGGPDSVLFSSEVRTVAGTILPCHLTPPAHFLTEWERTPEHFLSLSDSEKYNAYKAYREEIRKHATARIMPGTTGWVFLCGEIPVGETPESLLIGEARLALSEAQHHPSLGSQRKADINATKTQIGNLESALKLYAVDMRTFPSGEDGLSALIAPPSDERAAQKWNGPYLDDQVLPLDPWDQQYGYEYPPSKNARDFPDIWSAGPDGESGTDEDIGNWKGGSGEGGEGGPEGGTSPDARPIPDATPLEPVRDAQGRSAPTPDEACGRACAGFAGCATTIIVFLIAIVALHIALLVWVARDAKARGMDSAVLWMFLVMATGLIGLIIYLLSKPQGNLLQCSACGNKRLQASARCPHCGNP